MSGTTYYHPYWFRNKIFASCCTTLCFAGIEVLVPKRSAGLPGKSQTNTGGWWQLRLLVRVEGCGGGYVYFVGPWNTRTLQRQINQLKANIPLDTYCLLWIFHNRLDLYVRFSRETESNGSMHVYIYMYIFVYTHTHIYVCYNLYIIYLIYIQHISLL